jgi:alpha-1,2-mannosyltransferase
VAPADAADYWRGTFLATSRIGETAERGNQSLAGLLARLADPEPPSTSLWLVLALLAGVTGMGDGRLGAPVVGRNCSGSPCVG